MRPGTHAAGDGSFGRSAGSQSLRGAALLVVAVIIGILLLRTAPGERVSITPRAPTAPKTTLARATPTTAPGPTPPTTAALRSPAQISILVANGTRVAGAAQKVKNTLLQAGYNTLTPSNATSSDTPTTIVNFQPGYDTEAAAAVAVLSLPASSAQPMPSPPPVSDTKGANLVVVVGTDLAAQSSSGGSGSSGGSTSGGGSGSGGSGSGGSHTTNPPPPTSPHATSPTTARPTATTTHAGSPPTTVKH